MSNKSSHKNRGERGGLINKNTNFEVSWFVLFERVGLWQWVWRSEDDRLVLEGHDAAALDLAADAEAGPNSGGKPEGDVCAGMATYRCAFRDFWLGWSPGTKYYEEKDSLVV